MSFDKKNTAWLTPLLRWLSGEATRRDEQSLDMLAKDDPFLADALDGYRSQPEGHHAATVTKLKANLRRRTRKRRGVGFYLLQAAAIGVVLVAAWFVFRQFEQSETARLEVADRTTQVPEKPAAGLAPLPALKESESIAETSHDTAVPPSFSKKKSETSGKETEQLTFSDEKKPPLKNAPAEKQASQVFNEEKIATDDTVPVLAEAGEVILQKKESLETKVSALENAKAGQDKAAKRKSDDNPVPADATALNAPRPPGSQARTITGKITEESGEPLIGANVLAKGTNIGTITNIDGSYSINVPPSVPALRFAYVGYTTLEVNLSAENRLDVQLSESGEALSEVVVTGYSQSKERRVVSPKPKGGFKKFEKYIRENMRRPDAGAPSQTSGIVSVRFRILPDGKLTDFQPTSSLGQEFKDEAVRLLREGPKWKGEPGSFTSYAIRF